jgi:hypothetical protein
MGQTKNEVDKGRPLRAWALCSLFQQPRPDCVGGDGEPGIPRPPPLHPGIIAADPAQARGVPTGTSHR